MVSAYNYSTKSLLNKIDDKLVVMQNEGSQQLNSAFFLNFKT